MKVNLYYNNHYWDFCIEPETEIEKCAFNYFKERPKNNFVVHVEGIGEFTPLDITAYEKSIQNYKNELQSRKRKG